VLLRPRAPQTTRPSPAPLLPHAPQPVSSSQRHLSATANGWDSACTKLEDLAIHVYDEFGPGPCGFDSTGTQLLSLSLPQCFRLTNLAPLAALVNLQSLSISWFRSVSDLTPLTALVKLQTLDVRGCRYVSTLAPLEGMVNLKNLRK
jgi:hypothetical protein